jgi:hypothetical protein
MAEMVRNQRQVRSPIEDLHELARRYRPIYPPHRFDDMQLGFVEQPGDKPIPIHPLVGQAFTAGVRRPEPQPQPSLR